MAGPSSKYSVAKEFIIPLSKKMSTLSDSFPGTTKTPGLAPTGQTGLVFVTREKVQVLDNQRMTTQL